MLASIFETARHLIGTSKIVIKQIPQFYLIPAVSAASENLLHVQLAVYWESPNLIPRNPVLHV